MELNYFKDKIFDTINEGEEVAITDIETADRENKLYITVEDGTRFEIIIGIAERNRRIATRPAAARNDKNSGKPAVFYVNAQRNRP